MKIQDQKFDQERALYGVCGAEILDCAFDGPADGESALKESTDLVVERSFFNLRYPLWHTKDAVIRSSRMTQQCRAALWYDENITLEDCSMEGIKALRECHKVILQDCAIQSPEFAWRCGQLQMENCTLTSEYPFFECRDLEFSRLDMKGKYSFQYVENAVIRDSELDTKDAFWHSKNVTVMDSVVRGEYLGWYSERLRLVRCRIIGTQPLCYCKDLILEDCTMEGTDLAFERSEVRATVRGAIDSVKNPLRGRIRAERIGRLIQEENVVDPAETEIVCDSAEKRAV